MSTRSLKASYLIWLFSELLRTQKDCSRSSAACSFRMQLLPGYFAMPLLNQLSCCEKSKPRGQARCRCFRSRMASSHLSPVISHVREDNSRRLQRPAVPATPSPYFSQKVQTRRIVPLLSPVQIPKPQKHEHDKMVIVWVVT